MGMIEDNAFESAWKVHCNLCGQMHMYFHSHIKQQLKRIRFMDRIINYGPLDPYYYPKLEDLVDGIHYQINDYSSEYKYEGTNCSCKKYHFEDRVVSKDDEFRKFYKLYLELGWIRCIRSDTYVWVRVLENYGYQDPETKLFYIQENQIRVMKYFEYNMNKSKLEYLGVVDKIVLNIANFNKLYYYDLSPYSLEEKKHIPGFKSYIIVPTDKMNNPKEGWDRILNTYGGFHGNIIIKQGKFYELTSGGFPIRFNIGLGQDPYENPYKYVDTKENVYILTSNEILKAKIEEQLSMPYRERLWKKDQELFIIDTRNRGYWWNSKKTLISSNTMTERIDNFMKYYGTSIYKKKDCINCQAA